MTTNRHGVPTKEWELLEERDDKCVYCGEKLIRPWSSSNRTGSATFEHFNHLKEWDSIRDYVSRGKSVTLISGFCCGSCNYSRGDKALPEWFKSSYCTRKNINEKTVAKPVRDYLQSLAQ